MERISLRAYGKVNIGLNITGVREDGYHLLETVMQTVDIYDEILLRKIPSGIKIKTNRFFIPTDERNLAYKAAQKLIERYSIDGGVRIDIGKRIPVGGGMAGGSTDAASVIEGMDELYELNLSAAEKDEIALSLGADVPFCLRKGAYLAKGIGEDLERLNDLPDYHVVIYAPGFSVSTQWAYGEYDAETEKYHPDIKALVESINAGDEAGITKNMGNSLEPVVIKEHAEIASIIKELEELSADKAMMSGSGSTVFGLFKDKTKAMAACDKLNMKKQRKTVFLTSFVNGENNGDFKTEL